MARGGGTGARNKQKKKSDTVISNGTTANGISESEKFAQTKQITKQKKDEESTVAAHNDDDATKDEKAAKIQPTSEQLRLAQITQGNNYILIDQIKTYSHLDPQRKGKISQVIDFTGKTEDEVATALFDCSWDVQKAVELLLEEGGDLGSWEETGKKKKKKQEKDKEDRDDWDDNFEPVNSRQDSDHYRDRSRGGRGGAPRFKRGGGPGLGRQDREGHDSERMEGGRGRGYGRGGMSRGRGGRGPYRERGGRGGSIRGMGGAPPNYMGDRDRGVGLGPDSGPFGQMDTWNPSGDDMNGKTKSSSKDAFDNAGNWGDDFPAAEDWDNDEYTGSLSDTKVFTPSGATSNIKSAVGQPINSGIVGQPSVSVNNGLPGAGSGPTANPSTYGQQIDLAALLQKPGITPVQPGGSSAAPGGPTSINQFNQTATQDLKSAIGIGGPSPASNSSSSVVAAAKDHLSSAAASSFSSSIDYSSGAASSGGAGSGSAGSAVGSVAAASQFSHNPAAGSNFGSSTPGSAFSPIKPASVTNVNPSASKSMPRARLPPPSKIPASAVEMPGDSLANLDVQFGGLDLQFGASNDVSGGSSVGGGSSGFDFRASSLSAASKDLDSSSKYIAITSTDNYTNKSNSVAVNVPGKEVVVNPNLTSAMSVGVSAAMKAVSSSDSYGAASAATSAVVAGGQQRGDSGVVASKPNSNFSTQRSPGPVQSMDRSKPPVAVTDSLGGFSTNTTVGYSGYQVSNQSKQSSNQFGGHSSGGSSTGYPGAVNGYDRQSSSGYSSASYGSGSVSSSFGGGNSQQSGSSQNNGTGSGVNTSNVGYSNNTGSSGVSSSNTSNAFNSGYGNNSYSSYSTKSTNPTGKLENSSGGGSYSSNNFGISSGVSGNKMNMNSSVSSKMLHNLPPGVANMIPQYMMTGAGATFPHYLAAGLQQPAMYGYGAAGAAVGAAGAAGAAPAATQGLQGRGGVSSQQLEDLAAMQRSTLANLPLVGGSGQAGSQPSSKGPHSGYYDPSSAFGSGQASSVASTRSDAGGASATMSSDSSNKFGGAGSGAAGSAGGIGSVTDNTSSPVPSTVATGQPTPFNALANTFAAAPTQHLPPGYAYFYGGMTPQLQAAYGGTSVYPPHPGIVPTAAGPTATTQFQNKGYGSSYNSYDNLNLGQNNSDYKSNFPSQGAGQTKGTNSTAGHWYNGGIW